MSAAAIATTALEVGSDQKPYKGGEFQLPVSTRQLPSDNGVISVELQCGVALLTAPNRLEDFSCILINRTNKPISALVAAYTIITEKDGKRSSDTSLLTLDSFIHPDVREARRLKNISSGEERTIQPAGPITYEGAEIKGVEVRMDYVEFEDKTTLGPNESGARVINLPREGAAKYKEWLVQKYRENGKSVNAITSLLQEDQLPSELNLNEMLLIQGAKVYRKQMLNLYKAQGDTALEKYLNR